MRPRQERNEICLKKLLDDTGVWRQGTAKISDLIMQYFSGLFTDQVDAPVPNGLALVKRIVIHDMINALPTPY